MSNSKKTPAVVETMTPEDTVNALISIQDGLKELKAATDQLATILGNLGTMAGLAKDGVIAATAKPGKPSANAKAAAKPKAGQKPAAKPTAKEELLDDIAKKSAPKQAPKPKAQAKKEPAEQAKPAPQPQPQAPQPQQVKRASASVRLTPHELTLNIGAEPVKELAVQDAKEFLGNPKVFWYRQLQFPDPKRYGVQPRITSARVVERTNPKFTRAPWTVSVTIEARGDDKRCENWLAGVLNKNRSEQE